eukprot:5594325-Lingulodinium_polyedra.AAC.1
MFVGRPANGAKCRAPPTAASTEEARRPAQWGTGYPLAPTATLRRTTLGKQHQMDSSQPCAVRCAKGRWGATRARPIYPCQWL